MRRLAPVLLVAALALIAGGVYLLTRGPGGSGDMAAVEEALRSPSPQIVSSDPLAITSTTDEPPGSPGPPESPPTADAPPLTEPVRLLIPQLGIDAPVSPYGVDASGQMDVPNNVTEVAWYRFGPKPGEAGSAVLAAHVDLAGSGPGVFFELDALERDDRLTIIGADGTEQPFRVIARGVYEKDELPLDVIFSRQGPPVLTLITCGGDFNRTISRYDSNVVVYAVPMSSDDLGSLR